MPSEAARREMRQLVMLVCVWHRREALAAVQEAIHISQEMNDPVCLQHALVCTLGTMTLTCPSVCVCVCLLLHLHHIGWRHGIVVSGVRRMNEVYARRARLVPGWVTVFGRVYHLGV